MKECEIFPIKPDFTVWVDEDAKLILSGEIEERVNVIWEDERKRHKFLDEQILNLIAIKSDGIIGHFIPYKYVLALKRDPTLKEVMQVCTIGVTAITECVGHVLVGKRSKNVSHYPDCYELAPSGGVDSHHALGGTVNIYDQLLDELEEETGIKRSLVVDHEALFMAQDFNLPCIDLCIRLDLKPSALGGLEKFNQDEYSQMNWVAEHEVPAFSKKGKWVPFSKELCTYIRPL